MFKTSWCGDCPLEIHLFSATQGKNSPQSLGQTPARGLGLRDLPEATSVRLLGGAGHSTEC